MSASTLSPDEQRIAEAIGIVETIGPLLNGKSHLAIISALSALLRTVIVRAHQEHGHPVEGLLQVVIRHARPTTHDLHPVTRH